MQFVSRGILIFILFIMITLSIGFLIALIALYYAFQGRPVTIDANKYILNGRLYGKAGAHRHGSAILFLSDWNPTRHRVTTSNFYAGFSARKRNNICLTVSLRGMGSEGDINVLTRTDFMDDVLAAYDYLANTEGVNKEDIRVVGESFGGYLACILSTLRPVKKMALRVPTDFSNEGFDDIPQIQIAGNSTNDWKNQKHSFAESYALKAINEYKGWLMMVASEKDNFVPIQTTKNYLDAVKDTSKLEYLFMKKATHSMFHPKLQWDYTRKLLNWLRL